MALLTGNTAVITGGASGIGLATASRFVDEGAQEPADATHVMRRSSSQDAGQLPVTAHDIAMAAAEDSLPARLRGVRERRAAGIRYRTTNYERWRAAANTFATAISETSRARSGL
jgi:NAD(P)-dependent dehydrogenase (short-subunit alcohol dehydrogenase family)